MSAARFSVAATGATGLLIFLFVACQRGEGLPVSKSTEPVEKTAQVSVWANGYEIFLEHRLLVAGKPTGFVTHITNLETHKARAEGKVTFVLQQEHGTDTPIEHVESVPARLGIYIPELTFPKAGPWQMQLRIPEKGRETTVELPSLKVYASEAEVARVPEPEAPEGISFLKEQAWRLGTRSDPAERRRMVERLRVSGTVSARPDLRAAVTPPIAGRLLPPPGKPLPSLGDRVQAGQTLALVQPPFSEFAVKLVEAEAGVIRAKLAVDHAELVWKRVEKLAASKAKSKREAVDAEFGLRQAKAEHSAALALRAAYEKAGAVFVRQEGAKGGPASLPVMELKAPIAGIITSISAAVGEHIPSDLAVMTILDSSKVYIQAMIPEADVPRMATAKGASYETPDARGRFVPILGEGKGRVVCIGLEVDPKTRTVPVTYEVENAKGQLRIGMALNLYLETAHAEDAMAVPESAIVEEDGRPVIFVQVSGETFQKRHPKLGIRESGYVQVLSGLEPNERVVTRGAYAVKLASVATSIPAHGHAH